MTDERRNKRITEKNNTRRSIKIGLIKKEYVGEQREDANAGRVIWYDEERSNAKPESHVCRLEGKVKWILEKRGERVCV